MIPNNGIYKRITQGIIYTFYYCQKNPETKYSNNPTFSESSTQYDTTNKHSAYQKIYSSSYSLCSSPTFTIHFALIIYPAIIFMALDNEMHWTRSLHKKMISILLSTNVMPLGVQYCVHKSQ
jgi:hypothetical protein